MTQMYLVRHAQQVSVHQPAGPLLADDEDGLTEKGHAEARRVAERISTRIEPEALYSSPVLGARQTARHIGSATGLPPIVDINLAELRLNCPLDTTNVLELDGWVRARRYPYTPPFLGGEALADLQRRALQAFDMLARTHWGKKVVVVTHGGWIEMVLYALLGIPLEHNLTAFVRCEHTAIFHWHWLVYPDLNLSGWELAAANDTRHLEE